MISFRLRQDFPRCRMFLSARRMEYLQRACKQHHLPCSCPLDASSVVCPSAHGGVSRSMVDRDSLHFGRPAHSVLLLLRWWAQLRSRVVFEPGRLRSLCSGGITAIFKSPQASGWFSARKGRTINGVEARHFAIDRVWTSGKFQLILSMFAVFAFPLSVFVVFRITSLLASIFHFIPSLHISSFVVFC